MDKTAQKRSLLNKLHEMANVPARSAENFFKPELKRIMTVLNDADDVIRSTLSGEKIGRATPEDSASAKDLLKEAKGFINRREYLSAVSSLGRFHKKVQDASNVLEGLKVNVNSLHHKFLFDKLPGKHKEQLDELGRRFASERLPYFTKEAGIMDFFHNIGTQRGRALAAWEKRYPDVVGKIRQGAEDQLESSQELLNDMLITLKTMASYRASRNIDAYLKSGEELSRAFKKYDTGKNGFRNYYTNVIKPYMDAQRKIEEEASASSSAANAVGNMLTEQSKQNLDNAGPFGEAPPSTGPFSKDVSSNSPSDEKEFGSVSIPGAPPVPTNVDFTAQSIPSPTVPDVSVKQDSTPSIPVIPSVKSPAFKSDEVAEELFGPQKSSYHAFIDSLEVFSNENPALLAAHISKYAKSIQSEQPETALKLFKIAKSLRG